MNRGLTSSCRPEAFLECEYQAAVQQLTRYSGAVEKEFTLVNDRMTWLAVSESFIFAAFATSAAYYSQSDQMKFLVAWLLVLMPVLGSLMCAFVIPAICAAHSAVGRLKTYRQQYEDRLPERLRIKMVSLNDPEHFWGNFPAWTVPPLIMFIWLVLGCLTSAPLGQI
jgi:hypothetical protein